MSVTVTEIIRGGSAERTRLGIKRVRRYTVEGLDPNADPISDALVAPGIPIPGQPDRYIAGIYCDSVVPEPLMDSGKTTAIVAATFVPPELSQGGSNLTTVEIQTTESQVLTQYDRKGNMIVVTYIDPKSFVWKNYGEAQKFRSEITLVFSRTEFKGKVFKASDYAEHINSNPFMGMAKELWRCCSADATSLDGGNSYQRKYVFRYRKQGWRSDPIFYEHPMTGVQPTDILKNSHSTFNIGLNDGNGFTRAEIYDTADFTELGLPDVSSLI